MTCRNVLMLFSMSLLIVLSLSAEAAETYEVDPAHSMMVFHVNHLGVSNIYGRFNEPTGAFIIDEDNPGNSSVEIEVKAENVDTANEKRDQHLKSPDFFNVKQFPVITFKSKEIKKADEETYEVTGDFSLHGVTKPLTLKVNPIGSGKDPSGSYRAGFGTTFTIKRSDFGMDFMLGGVGDEIQLMVNIEGIRQ